jgi:hypothetical protein
MDGDFMPPGENQAEILSMYVELLKREKYFGKLVVCFEAGQIVRFDQNQVLKMKDISEKLKK